MLPSVSQIWRGLALALLASLLLPGLARAQWVSESYSAPLGYSAIWVGLDLSHTTIDEALAGKTTITEVWRWNPPSGPQFVTNPDTPVQPDTKWSVWKRGLPTQSTLAQFTGNAGYLIKVESGATVAFTLKGAPCGPITTGAPLASILWVSPWVRVRPPLRNFSPTAQPSPPTPPCFLIPAVR